MGNSPLNLYLRIVLILIGIAYLISPVDIIPDFLVPFLGFIDDGLIMAVIYYLIRYGTLPAFFFKKKQNSFQASYDQKFYGSSTESSPRSSGTSEKKQNSDQGTPKTPYDILGIRPGASKEEITVESIYQAKLNYEHHDLRQRLEKYHGKNTENAFRGWHDVWLHPAFIHWNIEKYLPKIKVPMLALQGNQDQYHYCPKTDFR